MLFVLLYERFLITFYGSKKKAMLVSLSKERDPGSPLFITKNGKEKWTWWVPCLFSSAPWGYRSTVQRQNSTLWIHGKLTGATEECRCLSCPPPQSKAKQLGGVWRAAAFSCGVYNIWAELWSTFSSWVCKQGKQLLATQGHSGHSPQAPDGNSVYLIIWGTLDMCLSLSAHQLPGT